MTDARTLVLAALLATGLTACSGPVASPAGPTQIQTATTVTVILTSAGCAPDRPSVPAGAVTFNVTNQGADAVSEVELLRNETVIGEKENLTPGLSASFTVNLDAGSYIVECPGATTDKTPFEVTAN